MPGNEFEAQFKRSGGESPPQTTPRNVIDGKEAIAKYIDGSKAPMEMTGAELHACVAHLKTTYGGAADGLEADLMKIRRQQDKKIKLVERLHIIYLIRILPAISPRISSISGCKN